MAISDRDPFRLLRRTRTIIQEMGWTGLGKSAIGTAALTVIFGGVDVFNALLSIPVALFQTLASLIPGLNEATIGGVAGFFSAAFGAGAGAFGSGWVQYLGIFQTPLGVGVGLITLWELMYFLDLVDSDFFGIVLDAPDVILNSDDSGVADEDE